MSLELIPTDDLIREIHKRCDHCLVAFLRVGEAGALIGKHRSWKGNPETTIGLAVALIRLILEHMRGNEVSENGVEREE